MNLLRIVWNPPRSLAGVTPPASDPIDPLAVNLNPVVVLASAATVFVFECRIFPRQFSSAPLDIPLKAASIPLPLPHQGLAPLVLIPARFREHIADLATIREDLDRRLLDFTGLGKG
jgi:hypothetical protein